MLAALHRLSAIRTHKGSDFTPVKREAKASSTVYFCVCKQRKNGALCDGSHKSI
ncbi:MAG: hypothetical protein WCN85_02845 [Burkholderiales bacterium]